MRLGQAKREFNVETSKIVSFLQGKGISISDHPNSKLTEDQVKMIEAAFPPKQKETPKAATEPSTPVAEPTPAPKKKAAPKKATAPEVGEVIEIKAVPKKKAVATPAKGEEAPKRVFSALDEEDEETAKAEVIRAPKQALGGLKIVGKVDLPTPKVKEAVAAPADQPKPEEKIAEKVIAPEEPDELAHLHPSKRQKIKAQKTLKEIETAPRTARKIKEKKREKSISEKIAEQKAQEQKKRKKKNPHRHIRHTGESAHRIEISDDGTILPRKEETVKAKKTVAKEGLWKRFWRWFNS